VEFTAIAIALFPPHRQDARVRNSVILFLALVPTLLAWGQIRPVVYQGERFVRLDEMAAFYGGELIPTPSESVRLKTRRAELAFRADSRELRLGNTLVWLHEPMQRLLGAWAIREVEALRVVDPMLRPPEYLRGVRSRVVVLDPGHGGIDTGAKGRHHTEEKRAALDIARRVRAHLLAVGLTVYMTRENDRFIELEERSRMAKRLGADLFVSIHLNSAENTLAQGVETFVLASPHYASTAGGSRVGPLTGNQYDAAHAILGFQVHRSLLEQTGAIDRGLKRSRFIVLKNAPCPAVLVECGFLSHADEEKKLMTEAYRAVVARGIAKGIVDYVNYARQAQRGQP
jgi:N-acetylmuramoyl-L-alanine amidase